MAFDGNHARNPRADPRYRNLLLRLILTVPQPLVYDTVKNGIGGAMCAMNYVNGTYACENQDILAKHLKVELGFPGIVHPDAGAQHDGIESANAGEDYGSSSYWSNSTLGVALTNGSFTEERLNDMAVRNLIGYYHQNQDQDYPSHADPTDYVDVRGNHPKAARAYGAESIALLKNTNNALPLKGKRSISIFGSHAAPRYLGPNTDLSVYSGTDPTMIGRKFPKNVSQQIRKLSIHHRYDTGWWERHGLPGLRGDTTALSQNHPVCPVPARCSRKIHSALHLILMLASAF